MACRKFSVELEWANTAPQVGRHLIGMWLDGSGCDREARDHAVLVASELISAAVNERIGAPMLDAELWHGTLIVWVSNGPSLADQPVADENTDLRARVLSATCDDWGVDLGVAGTRHWASLDLDDRFHRAA